MDLGEIWTATVDHSVTQADLDAGQIGTDGALASELGTATVTANGALDTDPGGVLLAQNPSILLTKTGTFTDDGDNTVASPGDGDGFGQPGEQITYAFTVTNNGNVTLTGVTLEDTTTGVTISAISDLADDDDVFPATVPGGDPIVIVNLAPGAIETATGSYALLQEDIDAGRKDNTATATGTPPTPTGATTPPPNVSGSDDERVTLTPAPAIAVVKTGTLNVGGGADATEADLGDTISYTFDITSTGNVTLTNVTLADTVGGVTITGNPIASLAPGATNSVAFSGSYTLTQEDIDAREKFNAASVTGTPPTPTNGAPATPPIATDDDTVPVPQNSGIQVVKTATGITDTNTNNGPDAVGDTINYTYTVTNTGNVTLTGVTLTDDGGTPGTLAADTEDDFPITLSDVAVDDVVDPLPPNDVLDVVLAPGAIETGTASHVITQADIDNGSFTNVGLVSGTPPTPTGGTPPSDISDSEPETVNFVNLSLSKSASITEDVVHVEEAFDNSATVSADLGSDAANSTGDLIVVVASNITYTLKVDNNGDADAENVTIVDTLPAGLKVVANPDGGIITTSTEGIDTITWNVGTVFAQGTTSTDTVPVPLDTVTVSVTVQTLHLSTSP